MAKTRVAYPKELKKEAKNPDFGLVTISVTFPDGSRLEEQQVCSASECQFAKWAAACLFADIPRPLPDLQKILRNYVEKIA